MTLHPLDTLTGDAFALLIHGVMRRARGIDGAAQFLRLLVGRRLYELDGRLKDTELQSHSHLWRNGHNDHGNIMIQYCISDHKYSKKMKANVEAKRMQTSVNEVKMRGNKRK